MIPPFGNTPALELRPRWPFDLGLLGALLLTWASLACSGLGRAALDTAAVEAGPLFSPTTAPVLPAGLVVEPGCFDCHGTEPTSRGPDVDVEDTAATSFERSAVP